MDYRGQGGLGDVILHPDYAENGIIYLSYAESGVGKVRGAAVARGRLDFDDGDNYFADGEVIWRQNPKVTDDGHYGHRMAFDADGYLFISSGDRQKFVPAQQMNGNLGKIVRLHDDGSIPEDNPFFEEGDVLLSIDPRDYEADVKISEAALMDARQSLAEEEARSEQATYDWKRLGNEGEAPDLVLRIPQMLASEARVISADSNLDKTRLDLERTNVVAPFAGRILTKFVDVGQVVSNNPRVADVYATDYVEIRLPLRDRDLAFIDLPESYRFRDVREEDMPSVLVKSTLVEEERWAGKIVRTEGAIDDSARQLHVVAQIDDPFGYEGENKVPLKIGQYVTASIEGQIIPNAVVIPGSAIYQGSYAYVVEDGVLQRRDIKIAWANDTESVIRSGLEDGDELVITPLGQVTSGVRVSIEGQPRNFHPPQGMNFTGDGPPNREGRESRSGGGAKPGRGIRVQIGI